MIASEVLRSPVAPGSSAVPWKRSNGHARSVGSCLVGNCSQLPSQYPTSRLPEEFPFSSEQEVFSASDDNSSRADPRFDDSMSRTRVSGNPRKAGRRTASAKIGSGNAGSGGRLHPALVTESIRDVTSFSELQALLDAPHVPLNHFHVSTLWLKLAELSEIDPDDWVAVSLGEGRALPAWLPRNFVQSGSLDSFEGDWETYDDVEDEYSDDADDDDFGGDSLWTRDQLMHLREQRLRARSSYSASSSSSNPHPHSFTRKERRPPPVRAFTRTAGPLGIPVNAAQLALGSLCKQVGGLSLRLAQRMEPRAISISMSCMAQMRYHDPKVLAAFMHASEGQLTSGSVQPMHVASMVWACSVLKFTPSGSWLNAAVHATTDQMDLLTRRQVCTMVHCFAKLQYRPRADWMESACMQLPAEDLRKLRPCDLSRLIAGLAELHSLSSNTELRPDLQRPSASSRMPPGGPANMMDRAGLEQVMPGVSHEWFDHCIAASAARLHLYDTTELCQVITALASFNMQPSQEWMVGFYKAASSLMTDNHPEFNAGHASTYVKALASMNCRPGISWLNEVLSCSRASLKTASSADLVSLVSGLAALRFRAGEGWLRTFLAATFRKVPYFSTEQCCITLAALAKLGQRPPQMWLSEVALRMRGRMSELSGQQLVEVLCALVSLGYRPSKSWLAGFEKHTHAKMSDPDAISAEGLAEMTSALAQLKYKPQISWLYSLVLSSYRRLDSFDAPELSRLFRALPTISQPGWLDELVQICAAETSGSSLQSWSESSGDEVCEISSLPAGTPGNKLATAAPTDGSSKDRSANGDPGSGLASCSTAATSFASAAARAARQEEGAAGGEAGGPARYGFFRSRAPPTPSRRTFLWSGVYLNDGSYDESVTEESAEKPTNVDSSRSSSSSSSSSSSDSGWDSSALGSMDELQMQGISNDMMNGTNGSNLTGGLAIPWDAGTANLASRRTGRSARSNIQGGSEGGVQRLADKYVGSIAVGANGGINGYNGGINGYNGGIRPATYRPIYTVDGSGSNRGGRGDVESQPGDDLPGMRGAISVDVESRPGDDLPGMRGAISVDVQDAIADTSASDESMSEMGVDRSQEQQTMAYVRSSPGTIPRSSR